MSRMPAKPAPAKGDPPGFITTIESVVSVLSILTASFYYYPSVKAKKFCIAVDGLNFHLDEVFCGTSHKKIFNCMCRAQSFFLSLEYFYPIMEANC